MSAARRFSKSAAAAFAAVAALPWFIAAAFAAGRDEINDARVKDREGGAA